MPSQTFHFSVFIQRVRQPWCSCRIQVTIYSIIVRHCNLRKVKVPPLQLLPQSVSVKLSITKLDLYLRFLEVFSTYCNVTPFITGRYISSVHCPVSDWKDTVKNSVLCWWSRSTGTELFGDVKVLPGSSGAAVPWWQDATVLRPSKWVRLFDLSWRELNRIRISQRYRNVAPSTSNKIRKLRTYD